MDVRKVPRLGLLINPVAGMGGRVGLKGTDGPEALRLAIERGATPLSPQRVGRALSVLRAQLPDIEIVTYPGEMGEDVARGQGFNPLVLGAISAGTTTPEDTVQGALDLVNHGIDILLFGGGDGTARNVLDAIGDRVPVIGVPAGVKMHSAVFATDPRTAGDVLLRFFADASLPLREAEVMDIDEEAFRSGRLSAHLYGWLMVPFLPDAIQDLKMGSASDEQRVLEGMAQQVVEEMEEGRLYIMGPGTTTRAIMQAMQVEGTLLGVDLVIDGQMVAQDVRESDILEHLDGGVPASIVVTPIGGQGFLFGRGNQQISAEVIRRVGREHILVVATKSKLLALDRRPLRVDTGDPEVDACLGGYISVITDYRQESVVKIR